MSAKIMAVNLGSSIKMEFVWIPPGKFIMGFSPFEAGGSDKSQHEVTLTKGFWMGKYPVTQVQWHQVMGNKHSYYKGQQLPMEMVSWNDCQAFVKMVVESLPGTADFLCRLPTEAEWEYACRANTTTSFYAGDKEDDLARAGWYNASSDGKTHEIGQKQPNAWGLYDMHGNVWEWCLDWHGEYSGVPETDPTGPSSGSGRVLRGGSWNNGSTYCRSAYRIGDEPAYWSRDYGFRVVLVVR